MSTIKTPFKYDFVGSFLRPQEVKDAKENYKNGKIDKNEYDKIINNAITNLVAKQKELGYHAITDGEFRRTFWHLDFMWGFDGVEHKATGGGVPFNGELAVLDDTYLVGKFKAKAHSFVEYFKFLKQFEDETRLQSTQFLHRHKHICSLPFRATLNLLENFTQPMTNSLRTLRQVIVMLLLNFTRQVAAIFSLTTARGARLSPMAAPIFSA